MSWPARLAAALAVVLALVAGAWRIHVKADAAGYARAQGEYAAQVAAEAEARRQLEHTLATTTQEIDRAHQTEKARLRAAAASADGRLRELEDALRDRAAPAHSAAPGRADDPARTVAGECAGALAALDEHAQSLAAQLSALQAYTGRVCQAPAD